MEPEQHADTVAPDNTEARTVLTEPSLLLNGRCKGHVEYVRHGTVLVIDWHDPNGCEHNDGHVEGRSNIGESAP